ncbi:hypothetical protein [Mixta calida]|uniref:hypothetical protein n=1 Tax=Mixta calida TaxID=665913 RepID=UPI0034D5BAA1
MKASISSAFQKRDKYASFHERRFAAMDIERAADSIRQRLPHGAKGDFNRTLSQMVKHIVTPPASGKAACNFDIKNRFLPGEDVPLNTVRLLTVYDFISFAVIAGKHEIAFSVVELAKLAPKEFPFDFSKLDAWRIVVDLMIDDGAYRKETNALLRNAARDAKLRHFFTNEPCVNGNIAKRRTSDGACLCTACRDHRTALERARRAQDMAVNRAACKSYRTRQAMREINGGAA